MNPGLTPNYGITGTLLEIVTARDRYNNKIKNFHEDLNMNRVLSERSLSLFSTKYSQAY